MAEINAQVKNIRSRDDDDWLKQFIDSKPTCFLILGKNSSGRTTLATRISRHWNCEHISFDRIFREGLSKELQILGWKEKNHDDVDDEEEEEEEEEEHEDEDHEGEDGGVVKKQKPNKFSLLKTAESESKIGFFGKLQLKTWEGGQITDEEVSSCLEKALESETVQHYGYVLDDLPWADPQTVFKKIKSWKLQPDIIVDLKISDQDLATRRLDTRIDPETGLVLAKVQYNMTARKNCDELWKKANEKPKTDFGDEVKNDDGEEEEENYDDEGEDETPKEAPNMYLEDFFFEAEAAPDNLVLRKRDHMDTYSSELKNYKNSIIPIVDEILSNHDQLKVIKLDGLRAPSDLFNQVKSILNEITGRLISGPAIKPVRLQPGADDDELPDELEDDALFRAVSKYYHPGPRFRWKRSFWGRYCPVELRENNILVVGLPQCCVAFLGKIYAFSSELSVKKFLQNPRTYLSGGPNLPRKLAILGNDQTSIPEIVSILAEKYDCKVINPRGQTLPLLTSKIDAEKAVKRANLMAEAIEQVKQGELEGKLVEFNKKLTEFERVQTESEGQEVHGVENPGNRPSLTNISIADSDSRVHEFLDAKINQMDFDHVKLTSEEISAAIPKNDGEIGNWIFCNFPETKEELEAMEEAGWAPDDVFSVRDMSENYDYSVSKFWEGLDENAQKSYRENHNKKSAPPVKDDQMVPSDSGVYEVMKKSLSTFDNNWLSLRSHLLNVRSTAAAGVKTCFDPIEIQVKSVLDGPKKISNDMIAIISRISDKRFAYTALDYAGMDAEEEEDDLNIISERIEAAEEEDLDIFGNIDTTENEQMKKLVRRFGESEKYDIIDLVEEKILIPGIQDFGAKFRDKLYFFRNEDNHAKFLENPLKYIPDSNDQIDVPPPRFFVIGAQSAGKSYLAKAIAKKHKLIHFDFMQRLQELTLSLMRVKLGPRHQEERETKRWRAIDIKEAVKLVEAETDIAELLRMLDSTSKEFQEAGKDAPNMSVVDIVKKMRSEDYDDSEPLLDGRPGLEEFTEGIVNALETNSALEPFQLEPIIKMLWTEEPYKSQGFVLEGFPNHQSDLTFLEENGLLPDCCIFVGASMNDCIGRQIDDQTKFYTERFDKQRSLRDAIIKSRTNLRHEAVDKKRKFIVKKKDEIAVRRAEKKAAKEARQAAKEQARLDAGKEAAGEGEEEEEEEEEEDVDDNDDEFNEDVDFDIDADTEAILQREFSDYLDDKDTDDTSLGLEEMEAVSDAVERIRAELESQHEQTESNATTVLEACEEFRIPRIQIDTVGIPRKELVKAKMLLKVNDLVWPNRRAICETPTKIKGSTAEAMLATGYAKISPYGKMDAVLVGKGKLSEWHSAKSEVDDKLTVLYNNEIFWFVGKETREEFLADPIKYADKTTRISSLAYKIPIRMAIVGPPKSGKTYLAERFSKEQNLLHISLGSACRRIITFFSHSGLAERINFYLLSGREVPIDLQIEAVEYWLLDEKARTQGYCFDGFPSTMRQVELLSTRGILPLSIIELNIDDAESLTRAIKSRLDRQEKMIENPNWHDLILHDSPSIIAERIDAYRNNLVQIKNYYESEHQNWHVFHAKQNRWKLWELVKSKVIDSLEAIQSFVQLQKLGKAAGIEKLCITPNEIKNGLDSKYQHLCPVSLLEDGEIMDSVEKTSLEFSAKYKNYFYRMADAVKLKKFLKTPEMYIDQANIPQARVEILEKSDCDVSFGKFCPVTRVQTGEFVYGKPYLVGKYKNKCFVFADEKLRFEFTKKPEIYSNIKLSTKIPPIPEYGECATELTKLPSLGYLEQSCSKAIYEALAGLSQVKPKIPWLSVEQTALIYTACHLKSFNKKSSAYSREVYEEKMKSIEEKNQLLTYLADSMTRRYREPDQRKPGFDDNLNRFYDLKK